MFEKKRDSSVKRALFNIIKVCSICCSFNHNSIEHNQSIEYFS